MRNIASLVGLVIGLYSPMIVFAAEPASVASNIISQSHIRSLAASCAACHGTNGNSANAISTSSNSTGGNSTNNNSSGNIPSISSIYKPTFIAQMLAFRSGERPATVMHRHAKGLTLQEIDSLAEYFAKQPRQPVRAISSQTLSEIFPN